MSQVSSSALPEPRTWRELLKALIAVPERRDAIAAKAQIGKVTLRRWAYGETTPDSQSLQKLIRAVPDYADLLVRLIRGDDRFSDFIPDLPASQTPSTSAAPRLLEEIPSTFYRRALAAAATVAADLRFHSIADLVLRQALDHLDSHVEGEGLVLTLARCLPTVSRDRVFCLHASLELGTPPWNGVPQPKMLLFGAESLAGYVVSTLRLGVSQNLHEPGYFPVRQQEHIQSSVAYPLLREQRTAGCLLVSSTKVDYFSPTHLSLIEQYTNLVALTFHDSDFFEPRSIQLRVMPEASVQQAKFASFRQRVNEVMQAAVREQQPISILQAEMQVWQALAEELASEKSGRSADKLTKV